MGFVHQTRKAGIAVRLGAAFGVLTLLLVISVAFGVIRLGALNETMQSLLSHEVRAGAFSATLIGQAHETSATLGRAVMGDSLDTIQANVKQAEKLRADSAATKKSLAETMKDEAGRDMLKKAGAAETAYRAAMDGVFSAIKSGDSDAARIALNEKGLRGSEATYMKALDELYAQQTASLLEAKQTAAAAFVAGRNLLFAVAIGAILLAVGLGFLITRSITKPIAQAVKVAETVAEGDLTAQITVTSRDEIGQLLSALKRMNANLAKTVNEVRSGVNTMATASNEIAVGNMDLSSRTEQQASSLEKTASSMEELTSTVKQNADNARQANQLAATASGVAIKGGDMVRQVVTTMEGITESSKKIADIITVIDGIAFQTNILALNAAVEAARAGEQGRGFAVVASEVRNLAQRSAAAAKEIKALINDSVEKVESGSVLVGEAGTTMDEIVSSVKRVTDIMSEITAASREQSEGIEQVNQAIGQMDQVTQQNAALVEESAAAAGSLQEQAGNLAKVVSVFKLDSSQLSNTTAPVQPARSKMSTTGAANKSFTWANRTIVAKAPAPKQIAAATTTNGDWEAF